MTHSNIFDGTYRTRWQLWQELDGCRGSGRGGAGGGGAGGGGAGGGGAGGGGGDGRSS